MSIMQGYENKKGKRWGYYQAGPSGKRYYYTPGNERSRKSAHTKAVSQNDAMWASK